MTQLVVLCGVFFAMLVIVLLWLLRRTKPLATLKIQAGREVEEEVVMIPPPPRYTVYRRPYAGVVVADSMYGIPPGVTVMEAVTVMEPVVVMEPVAVTEAVISDEPAFSSLTGPDFGGFGGGDSGGGGASGSWDDSSSSSSDSSSSSSSSDSGGSGGDY